MIAAGIDPTRIVVSVGALAIPDVVALSAHATARGVHGVLLMPPGIYRGGITEDGTFRYFAAIIERVANPALRLYLYHFPDICGVPITPQVIRRLDERYPGIIAGVKDSGGDLGFTQDLVRRFSHLSIFTGSEIHLPQLLGGDAILSRRPFIPSAKAVLAEMLDDPEWRRVIPPLPEIAMIERNRLWADFTAWDAGLPPAWQSLASSRLRAANVIDLRRA
jgi:4-hydroxy-tetrahydrodipicolinate synthase